MGKRWHGSMRGKPCSHPDKLLENHLINTKDIALKLAKHYKLSVTEEEKEAFLMHDLGKAHPAFQYKICRACPEARECSAACIKYNTDLIDVGHAAPSASLAMIYTKNLLISEVIRCHHTSLKDIDEIRNYWVNGDYNDRLQELKAIYTWPSLTKLGLWSKPPNSWLEDFPEEDEWYDICFELTELDIPINEPEEMVKLWLSIRKLYSLLVAADRLEAVVGGLWEKNRLDIIPSRINNFLNNIKNKAEGLGRNKLAKWRTSLYEEVTASAKEKLVKPNIYTLTLPTGAGKTLIGLSTAAIAAEKFEATGIIYVLPFISLVEQNAEVAGHLFKEVQEDHHLAYSKENKDIFDKDAEDKIEFLSFFRYWDSPVIVTTLSKLWEVIYSPRANDVMNFHRLSQAVIVLDEPQSIPVKYWEGLGKTFKLISQELGTTFILMTATQPKIVQGIELVNKQVYFPKERYTVNWLEEKLNLEDLPTFLDDKGWQDKDSLVIMNTREAALKLYLEAKRRKLPSYLLSRWLTPTDRKKVMEILKEKEELEEKRCLIATQVVEAGVDLDFAFIFRDLAPFDNIVQAAGRCNRHGLNDDLGEVWVRELCAKLANNTNRTLSSYVYDKVLLNQTRLLLSNVNKFAESEVANMVAQYYLNLEQAVSSDELWSDIIEGRWGSYYYLYEEQIPEIALIVDYDGSRAELLDELEKLPAGYSSLARRKAINQELGQHSINVSAKFIEEWDASLASFLITDEKPILEKTPFSWWILHPDGIGKIYFPMCGFIPLKYRDEVFDLCDMGY